MLGAHQAVRLHGAAARTASVVPVVEAQPLRVPADGGQFGQHGRIDGLPARGVQHRHGERVERADAAAQSAGQHLLQLAEGAHRALPDALDALPGGGPEAHRHGDRLVVVQEQRRQFGARAELVAAARAGAGVDGVAELAEPVDVTPHGARRHAEPICEVGTGPLAVGLQEGEELEQPCGGLQHVGDSPSACGQVRSAVAGALPWGLRPLSPAFSALRASSSIAGQADSLRPAVPAGSKGGRVGKSPSGV
ncbi:hypothetical protein GCM10010252_44730 [Streptomyces aureoverticillatus]|nr:hypothetical protein GCM10010252_44730 [Streptomyces aureoverticillatus]